MRFYSGRHHKAGQGLAEYALILSLIAVAAVLALLFVSGAITALISSVGRAIDGAFATPQRLTVPTPIGSLLALSTVEC
jgi:Flp pilus assembly pilin Flp